MSTTDTSTQDSLALDAEACIIGAGISGLTAAKALKQAGVRYQCFERGSNLGGLWRYNNDSGSSSAYRSLHIDSSRQSIGYPDFPVPDTLPDYLSHAQVLEHFERYATQFGLLDAIEFGQNVLRVEPAGPHRWAVSTAPHGLLAGTTGAQRTRYYRYVIAANGHLSEPRRPQFPGNFSGSQCHAHDYKTAAPFEDQRVLVVGIGNSAVDIAVDLARRARQVLLSTRRSAWIMPKYIAGIPTDRWLKFMTGKLMLPVPAARGLLRHIARLAIGDQQRFGIPKPAHPIWREHATLSQELLPHIGHGWIRMKPNIQSLADNEVVFVDGSREPVDAIIYATGYNTVFPFLEHKIFHVDDGQPPALYRRIVSIEHPGLFFAGLVQPVGATIPLVEIQARWMAAVLSGRISLPSRSAMQAELERHRARVASRYLNSARYTLEVDFREYSAEMLADINRH